MLSTIAGVVVAGYNGTRSTITAVPSPRTFEYTNADRRPRQFGRRHGDVLLAVPASGSAATTRSSIGGSGLRLQQREPDRPRSTRIAGLRRAPRRSPAPASTGLHGGHIHGVPRWAWTRRASRSSVTAAEDASAASRKLPTAGQRLVHAGLQRQHLGADRERTNYTQAGLVAAITPIMPGGAWS